MTWRAMPLATFRTYGAVTRASHSCMSRLVRHTLVRGQQVRCCDWSYSLCRPSHLVWFRWRVILILAEHHLQFCIFSKFCLFLLCQHDNLNKNCVALQALQIIYAVVVIYRKALHAGKGSFASAYRSSASITIRISCGKSETKDLFGRNTLRLISSAVETAFTVATRQVCMQCSSGICRLTGPSLLTSPLACLSDADLAVV